MSKMVNISNWFDTIKLALNVTKTKVMHFHHPRNFAKNIVLELKLDQESIQNVKTFKYLGIHLDHNLSFDEMSPKCVPK